jgi:aryl sulfotransferase
VRFIDDDASPQEFTDGLRGVFWHLSGAWGRREEPNIVLVHYADLVSDLPGEKRRLAGRLGIAVPPERWPALVRAATFSEMRDRADTLAPDPKGIFKDRGAFFRRGISGGGRELLTAGELEHYEERAASLAPADLLVWLHR